MEQNQFSLDGETIPFTVGQSIIQAALAAGKFIPHLCYHPEFKPHGSCRLCIVRVDGYVHPSCTTPAQAGQVVESEIPEIQNLRRSLIRMLLVEGNHFCPSCEKSGTCMLQSLGYDLGVVDPHFPQMFSKRKLDASHPDMLLDFNRCILCELCIRASSEIDRKDVFALSGRGHEKHLIVNSESGQLGDTDFSASDKAAEICPVGVILHKDQAFSVPIGQRKFDKNPIRSNEHRYTSTKDDQP